MQFSCIFGSTFSRFAVAVTQLNFDFISSHWSAQCTALKKIPREKGHRTTEFSWNSNSRLITIRQLPTVRSEIDGINFDSAKPQNVLFCARAQTTNKNQAASKLNVTFRRRNAAMKLLLKFLAQRMLFYYPYAEAESSRGHSKVIKIGSIAHRLLLVLSIFSNTFTASRIASHEIVGNCILCPES